MQRIAAKRKYFFYILSVIGVVIGISIACALIGLAGSGKEILKGSYWQKGTGIYVVKPESGMEADAVRFFDENDKQVKREMPEIKAVMSKVEAKGSLKSYRGSRNVDVIATGKDHGALYNLKMLKGRFISEEDTHNKRQALVIDDITAFKLFGKVDAVGRDIDLEIGGTSERFNIIGVADNYNKNLKNLYTKKIDGFCIIPESSLMEMGVDVGSSEIVIFASKAVNKEEFANKIEHYFSNHGLGTPETDSYIQLKEVERFMDDSLIAMILIALVTYILGCICFMSAIMLTVSQRQKEISMALLYGASYSDIRDEVLYRIELLALCIGAAGVVLGTLCSALLGRFLNLPAYFSFYMVAAAFGLAALAGIIAAFYPLGSIKSIDINDTIWGQ